ncbi:unnamed protein product [Discula destructiva]
MTQDDIWDDSALVNSWNEALAEYKEYHSIHATGGRVEDLLPSEDQQHAKPEPRRLEDAAESAPPSRQDAAANGPEAFAADNSNIRLDAGAHEATAQAQATRDASGRPSSMPSPDSLLASVQDDGLRKLLMSWYYAGFYTGFYQGQQTQQHQQR